MKKLNTIPRSEYPRPDFCRESWMCLNGEWDFSFETGRFDKKITVPFACETELSGICDTGFHPSVWYRKEFCIPSSMRGKRILLHFGAVDYWCAVWVNEKAVLEHEGGQSSFFADITDYVESDGTNTIIVQVEDDPKNLEQPRGKQFWEEKSRSIFYTRTTGIWQSVWLEAVNDVYLENVWITPDYDRKSVGFSFILARAANIELETEISFLGKSISKIRICSNNNKGRFSIGLSEAELDGWNFYEDLTWTPETPRLFNVVFRVYNHGEIQDEVSSYFGMRKISIEDGVILLNNRPYIQKLVLDQGYWPESLMTAPTDEAFIKDIELIKEMGFNGVRIHQKVEDPRFLYHADKMGLLVWAEIGSAYVYSPEYAKKMYAEWISCVERDYNHPCIITWVPLNESWGVQEIKTEKMQQSHSAALVYITKSIDVSRPVVDNDGWEHTCGDLCTIHDYESDSEIFARRYSCRENILRFSPGGRALFSNHYSYAGQPIVVSEFGGISFSASSNEGWGYSNDVDPKAYAEHITALIAALLDSPYVQGYCYTQLCDIETEQNGILFYDRTPKVDLKLISKANRSGAKEM